MKWGQRLNVEYALRFALLDQPPTSYRTQGFSSKARHPFTSAADAPSY